MFKHRILGFISTREVNLRVLDVWNISLDLNEFYGGNVKDSLSSDSLGGRYSTERQTKPGYGFISECVS